MQPGLLALGPEVEDVADGYALLDEVGSRRLDVVHDQSRGLGGTGRRRGHARADDDRASGPGRSQLDDAEALVRLRVDVHLEPELLVERLGAVHVGDREDHDLELVVHASTTPAQTPTRSSACSASRRAMTRRHRVSSAPSKIDSTRASTK